MTQEIAIKRVSSQPTMGVRVSVPREQIGPMMGEILPEVWGYLEGRGVHPAGPPFARYYGHDETNVDMEAGLPVAEPVEGEGRIIPGELPGGEVAAMTYLGPYEGITDAHMAVEGWLKANGREASDTPWEVYETDPGEKPDPAKWRTQIVWPVK